MAARKAKTKSTKPSKRPWLHGPVAWEIAERADAILVSLADSPKRFLSLRQAAGILGISTQPVRDWLAAGLLEASGPRKQIPARAVEQLVKTFRKSAQPYEMKRRLSRLQEPGAFPPWRFGKLFMADFKWPPKHDALRTTELAALAGCHPSLVIKAIHAGEVVARQASPRRWEITRRNWNKACFFRG